MFSRFSTFSDWVSTEVVGESMFACILTGSWPPTSFSTLIDLSLPGELPLVPTLVKLPVYAVVVWE